VAEGLMFVTSFEMAIGFVASDMRYLLARNKKEIDQAGHGHRFCEVL
jgi:hypothetical protein